MAWVPGLLVVVVVVVALAARLGPVLRGGGLTGVLAYDDGVYFGAADSLLSGRLPYRDFLLLHPPGIVLILSPFAALGRLTSDPTGLAAARLAFMAIGALNAVLAYVVARRAGRMSGIFAGALYAVWGPATYAERTTLLEPVVNLGLLGATALLGDVRVVTRRRLLAAGALLGVGVATKLWAALPLLVLAGWVAHRRGRVAAVGFVAAAAATITAVCLPFFLAAPGTMARMVVRDQLGRPDNAVPTSSRLAGILGYYHAATTTVHGAGLALVAGGLLVLAAAAWVVVRAQPELRVWVVLAAAQAALLLVGPTYYDHYATFLAPALVVILGAAAGVLLHGVRVAAPRWSVVAAAGCLMALAFVATTGARHPEGRRLPAGPVDRAVASASCVRADSAAALAVTNLLTRDLRRGCPVVVDVTGTTYDLNRSQLNDGRPGASRRADAAWQRYLQQYVSTSPALLVVQARADGLGPAARADLYADRVLLRARHVVVYAPRQRYGHGRGHGHGHGPGPRSARATVR